MRRSKTECIQDNRLAVAHRVLWKVARTVHWRLRGRVPLSELHALAAPAVGDVVARWDGRGRFEAFAAQRIRWRMLSELSRSEAREQRQTGARDGVAYIAREPDSLPDASADIERDTLRILTRRATERLPEPLAALIDGHYYEGESLTELAARLGMCKSTVADGLVRARRMLREALAI